MTSSLPVILSEAKNPPTTATRASACCEASVIITWQNAPSAVLMSLEDYDALIEMLHLLRSPRNAARLAEAIADVKAGKRVRARKLSAT